MSYEKNTTNCFDLPSEYLKKVEANIWELKLPRTNHQCPRCHNSTDKVHDYRIQTIKATSLVAHTVRYHKRRYVCTSCGKVFPEQAPFLSRYQRMTKTLICQLIVEHGMLSTSKDIARRYHVSAPTVSRLFSRVAPDSHKLPEAISLDEFKGDAGAKFQVVLNDLVNYTCCNIFPDRSVDKLYASLLEYPLKERLKVLYVSIDLSAMFRSLVRKCFPHAEIIADKFHAVRMANDALDTIRKDVQKALSADQRKYFKRSRYLLLKREDALTTDEDRRARTVLLSCSEKLSAAYAMKEAYFSIMESKSKEEFMFRLKRFQLAVEETKLAPFLKLLRTTLAWKKELLNACLTGLNNGFTEGCNTTIKTLKRLAYGFRNFENFKRRILFLLNDTERIKQRMKRQRGDTAA